MIGAIIGDIVGSTYEFHNTFKYDFELFPLGSSFTDDTICTIAVADAILDNVPYRDSLLKWCRKYPNPKGAYGASFSRWIWSDNPQPYDSYGNGAAMRVSPVGWAFDKEEDVFKQAGLSAECSHSHEEGVNGARAVALAIWYFSRHKADVKTEAKKLCALFYGKNYADKLPGIGVWNETCQGCVPLAFYLLSLSEGFEDAIRLAVSYGGDSDTLGAIVGGLAEAAFGVPETLKRTALGYLPPDMRNVITEFELTYNRKQL